MQIRMLFHRKNGYRQPCRELCNWTWQEPKNTNRFSMLKIGEIAPAYKPITEN